MPVIAPAEVMAREGVDKKLVKPAALTKLIPLMTLLLLFEAAGKLMPLRVLALSVLVALASARFIPLTVAGVEVRLPLVKERVWPEAELGEE